MSIVRTNPTLGHTHSTDAGAPLSQRYPTRLGTYYSFQGHYYCCTTADSEECMQTDEEHFVWLQNSHHHYPPFSVFTNVRSDFLYSTELIWIL